MTARDIGGGQSFALPRTPDTTEMPWLTWLLLESRPALVSVLGLALFVLLVYWRRTGRGRPLLAGLGLAAGLLITQELVVTRREHADRILRTIEKDLLAARYGALEAALADDFDAGEGLDRVAFLAYVRRQLEGVRIRWLDRLRLRMAHSEGGEFEVVASYRADVAGDYAIGSVLSEWALRFGQRDGRWRITHIRPVHIAGESNISWGHLIHFGRRHGV